MRRTGLILATLIMHLALTAQVWRPLDHGVESAPTAMTSIGNLLVTASVKVNDNNTRSHYIQVWNGYFWQDLPVFHSDSNSLVLSLQWYKGALYIAGKLDTIYGVAGAKHVLRWKDRTYEAVPGLNTAVGNFPAVRDLDVYQNQLVLSGPFVPLNTANGNNLLFYNGSQVVSPSTTAFGAGITGNIQALYSDAELMAMGGRFSKANDTSAAQLAYFKNGRWFRAGTNPHTPLHITQHGGVIYFYGKNILDGTLGFYAFNGSQIDTILQGLEEITSVYDLLFVNGHLYASGIFSLGSDQPENQIITYDGTTWKPIPNGRLLGTRVLESYQNRLVASGYFNNLNTFSYHHIAEYRDSSGVVGGKVFFDKDKNCIFSFRDENLNDLILELNPGKIRFKPGENGNFLRVLESGSYSIHVLPNKFWYGADCGPDTVEFKVEGGKINTDLRFPLLQRTGIRDLSVKLSSGSGWAVDRNSNIHYSIQYRNKGSEHVSQTKVVLRFDSRLGNISAKPAPDQTGPDSAVWLLNDLYSGQTGSIGVSFSLSNGNDEPLSLTASIPLQEDEEDPSDNESSLLQTLSETEFTFKKEIYGAQGDTLFIDDSTSEVEYQISFANYTSDTIRDVYVIDTIALDHDLSVIQTTAASHSVTSEAFPGTPGEDLGIIIWTFKDINLAPNPSHNPEIVSHQGFVSFKLGLKSGLPQGKEITNKGDVVFDYYEQEPTNMVYTLVDDQMVGVQDLPEPLGDLLLYPNPAHDQISLSMEVYSGQYQIISITGSTVQEGQIQGPTLSLAGMSPGMYVLKVTQEQQIFTGRFILQ